MAGWTNRGKFMAMQRLHNGTALPTNYYFALVTSAVAPVADTNTLGELTEITAGNGYTSGGTSLTLNGTDFITATEDDGGDLGSITVKDIDFVASGGAIPSAGGGARYAVLTDDNVTVGSREVYYYWDLVTDRSVSDGDTLRISGSVIRGTET